MVYDEGFSKFRVRQTVEDGFVMMVLFTQI